MKRGQIYYIRTSYAEEGSEQRGDRPAVIVSNDVNNQHSETIEVVYMTTQPKHDLPTHVYIRSALRPSTVLCEQICTVSKQRAGELIGELTATELQSIDNALAISLGLNFGPAPVKEEQPKKALETLPEEPERETCARMPVKDLEELAEAIANTARISAERDTYKQLYIDLRDSLIKGAKA